MNLPACNFYLFGMGDRKKIIYKDSKLTDTLTGEVLQEFSITSQEILPWDYKVKLTCKDGSTITIYEDGNGVYIDNTIEVRPLTESKINLPNFKGNKYGKILKILHQEVLINIVDGKPLPNYLVYNKPWYRDSAMMAMVLKKTENLHLIKDWIMGLREAFDKNNAEITEPDNLGQALFLISLVSDVTHPLVKTILKAVKDFEKEDYIIGMSDFSEHPVYQTKWLKYGLHKLGLKDVYVIPEVFDSYSSLFWMDYKSQHINGPYFDEVTSDLYPYLGWAEANFYELPYPSMPDESQYPITWESEASQANYNGLDGILKEYADKKVSAPHTWHASEMFLYLIKEMGD